MQLSQALEVSAFGVLLGALLATVGWIVTRIVTRSEARTRQDALDAVALAQAVRDIATLTTRQDKTDRRVTNHGEELAALGVIMDRHEKWHADTRGRPPLADRDGH